MQVWGSEPANSALAARVRRRPPTPKSLASGWGAGTAQGPADPTITQRGAESRAAGPGQAADSPALGASRRSALTALQGWS